MSIHYTGSGPSGATVSAYVPGTTYLAAIFSDAGLTVPTKNPFTMAGTTYDFYATVAYVAFGVIAPIYVESDIHTFAEYTAPQRFPRQVYTPTNVTTLRSGDFSTLVAADVRSILGTLIRDLKEAGILG